MKWRSFIFTIALLLPILSANVHAQGWWKSRGSGGWGHRGDYHRLYDTKTVETLRGVITEVDSIIPYKDMSTGIRVTLKASQEVISVHLGPAWYIENQDVDIIKNIEVEVTGSRVTFEGKPAIIAAELKTGDDLLKLRDESGFPVWNGWRRK